MNIIDYPGLLAGPSKPIDPKVLQTIRRLTALVVKNNFKVKTEAERKREQAKGVSFSGRRWSEPAFQFYPGSDNMRLVQDRVVTVNRHWVEFPVNDEHRVHGRFSMGCVVDSPECQMCDHLELARYQSWLKTYSIHSADLPGEWIP